MRGVSLVASRVSRATTMISLASLSRLAQIDEMLRPYDRAMDGRYDPDEVKQ